MRFFEFFLFFFLPFLLKAQQISVQPWLQDAEPDRMTIMWETIGGEESLVHWGLTDTLGQLATGFAEAIEDNSFIHAVVLHDLQPFTVYYYRVQTDTALSPVYHFLTPPAVSAESGFRLVAMSDMQNYDPLPVRYHQIVHEGVIKYVEEQYGEDLSLHVHMLLFPGDLVQVGSDHYRWVEEFFGAAHPLYAYVPVYPVRGGHDLSGDKLFYQKYFSLPLNGSQNPDYRELWWYKDFSNLRVIGLESLPGGGYEEQLQWLSEVLDSTCEDADIDFVFAQLHHPFKSELWTPGEDDYTGEVVHLLEQFSTRCAKPSIHFFGHTHAYSRGSSRDHNHLWVNVATAAGAIDYWNEWPQQDYDEFVFSQDEYGFVVVDIEAGDDPKFTLRRISQGDSYVVKDNTLEDSIQIRLNNVPPEKPVGLFPAWGEEVLSDCLVLKAGSFEDPDGDGFMAAHWQIATSEDFSDLVYESWKQYENWYKEVDTQAGDDLTDEQVGFLPADATLFWRVRYRDKSLGWSSWSDPILFFTSASFSSGELLINGGAEDSTSFWTVEEGVLESLEPLACSGIEPHSGERYFSVGGLCEESPYALAWQEVEVGFWSDTIDGGQGVVLYGAWLSNYDGQDEPAFSVHFYDENHDWLGATDTLSSTVSVWQHFQAVYPIPSGARYLRYLLMGTRHAGTDNDSYVDDASMRIVVLGDSCSHYNPLSSASYLPEGRSALSVRIFPNPAHDAAVVHVVGTEDHLVELRLYTVRGELLTGFRQTGSVFSLSCEGLKPGLYLLMVRDGDRVGLAKFMVE